jgi:clan AA aspartic protease (TIGR02281 family)
MIRAHGGCYRVGAVAASPQETPGRRSGIVIGWAFRQIAVCGAVIALFYAMIGYKLFEQPSATQPAPVAMVAAANRAPSAAAAPNSLLYRADKSGHVLLQGNVNGAAVRFMVDTGASFVALSMRDAEAAGISRSGLVFNQPISTANGVTRVAPVKLREVRIGQFSVADVPAVVHENLQISLLGQTFLQRLESYQMRDGVLTLNWN